MAINKKLIHFKNFSDFNSKKLSANENNTQYTLGISGAVTNGSPDILYQSICYIKDTKQQWTHGQLYDGSKLDTPLNETDPVFLASPAATITEANKQAWSNKQDAISDLATIRNGASKGATAVQPSSLATVATSGNYNDLTNKPTIPTSVTESTVSGWGFTKNTGTYSKPTTGIPVSDLAQDIQTALGKANTALQSYTEQYKGTITGVSANGTSVATSGVANIPAASTSKYGVTKLSTATNSTSTSLAATASAVKSAYDLANSKQEKLTSGTNIKTINGTSILGSGDIEIGGGVEWETAPGFYEMGYWFVQFQAFANTIMSPNKIYVVPNYTVGELDLTNLEHVNEYGDEYRIIFKTHDIYPPVTSRLSLNLSDANYNVIYENGIEPEFKADTWYDLRLIRTVHEGAQQVCMIATEFSNQPSSGGSSAANVQAVDTGDVLDDVTVNYATKTYVDGLVGDIDSVLDNIIDGNAGGYGSGKEIDTNTDYGASIAQAEPNKIYILSSNLSDGIFIADLLVPEDALYCEYTFIFETGEQDLLGQMQITVPDYVVWANGQIPDLSLADTSKTYELSIVGWRRYPDEDMIFHAVLTPFKPV